MIQGLFSFSGTKIAIIPRICPRLKGFREFIQNMEQGITREIYFTLGSVEFLNKTVWLIWVKGLHIIGIW